MDSSHATASLYAYTLERGDAAFVHQHVVDALCAQEADASTPPMRLVFALIVAPAGQARDAAIDAWCAAVWAAYGPCRDAVVAFLHRYGHRE